MGTPAGGRRSVGPALFGAARQGVLRLCFSNPDVRQYQQSIIEALRLGSGAVQRELTRLSDAGILARTKEGRQIYFQANRDCPVFTELRSLVRKTLGISGVLRDALSPLADDICCAFVYGSVATGTETAHSDVDIMIVSDSVSLDAVLTACSEAQAENGSEINPSVYSTSELRRKIAGGHHFLSSVMGSPKEFLIGTEDELADLVRGGVVEKAQNQSARDRRPARSGRSRSGSL